MVKTFDALPYEAQGQGVSSSDVSRGIFYIVGTNLSTDSIALVGISITTGEVLVEIPLPFVLEAFVGVGQYVDVDPVSHDVFVTGRSPTDMQHKVYRVNPTANTVTKIADVGDGTSKAFDRRFVPFQFLMFTDPIDMLGGISVLDPLNRVLWLQLAVNNSGEILVLFYG